MVQGSICTPPRVRSSYTFLCSLSRALSLSHSHSRWLSLSLARSLTFSLPVFLPHARALAVAAVPATAEYSCQHTCRRDMCVYLYNGLYIRVRSL